MRIPKAVGLYKQALQLTFPGLGHSGDMSNRTSVSLATTLYTIWHDPVTGKNRRSSAADGLLWAPQQHRPKLTVLATHKVGKVLFDKKLTATGVAFSPTNATSPAGSMKVYARKGVILSAGSLATPPILERSGIGSWDVLKAAGIHKLVDLPGVGATLNVGTRSSGLRAIINADTLDTGPAGCNRACPNGRGSPQRHVHDRRPQWAFCACHSTY
jgi:choline dehydrogenase